MKVHIAVVLVVLALVALAVAACSRKPQLPSLDEIQLPTVAVPKMPVEEELLKSTPGATPALETPAPQTPVGALQPAQTPSAPTARDTANAGSAAAEQQKPEEGGSSAFGVALPPGATRSGPTSMEDIEAANLLFTSYQDLDGVEYCSDESLEEVLGRFEREYDEDLTMIHDTGEGAKRLVVGTVKTEQGERVVTLGRTPDDTATRIRIAELPRTYPGARVVRTGE